tara:strand:- start:205 stop:456 length:252 start_codon:yes stop_codon:yes gene_type:complete
MVVALQTQEVQAAEVVTIMMQQMETLLQQVLLKEIMVQLVVIMGLTQNQEVVEVVHQEMVEPLETLTVELVAMEQQMILQEVQ